MPTEIDIQKTRHAAKTLCVTDEHEIVFLANTEISFLTDSECVVDLLSYADGEMFDTVNRGDIIDAIDEASVKVVLPGGLRLVGMALPGSDHRVYGIVDFSDFIV